jgi:hypothetical protein
MSPPPVGRATLRLPKALVEQMRTDLRRHHPFAHERVGFLSIGTSEGEDGEQIVIALAYHPVPDEHYVPGRGAGARIGSDAIREAMSRALTTGRGICHVHLHDHPGIPTFSSTDRREQPQLVPSLVAAAPHETHGMIVLSADAANAWLWVVKTGPSIPARLSIIGDPMGLLSGDQLGDEPAPSEIAEAASVSEQSEAHGPPCRGPAAEADADEQYVRQSFLGPDSQRRLGFARVGVIGFGGGGSHVGLQLAHLGVRHAVIADGDAIDRSNLNRLVGGTAGDVKAQLRKVKIAHRVITSVLPDAPVITHDGRWQERPLLFRGCDLLIGCVDTFGERRDLEVLARRFGIPYIDIGMDIHQVVGQAPQIGGQVLLSMPGGPCLTCLGFLTEERLAAEAALYGAAGGRPQVVWPNGILASSAVGIAVSLLTGWTGEEDRVIYLSYDGNRGTLTPHVRLQYLGRTPCPHFPLDGAGEPRLRRLSP